MDDLFKRGIISYVGLTAMLWLMSWGMEANHAAHAWNPAWGLISGLRDFFTWVGVIAAVGFVVMNIVADVLARKAERARDAHARREREIERIEDRKRQQRNAREQEAARKKAKQEEFLRQNEYDERLRKEKLEKLQRSASAATNAALDDF